MHSSFLITIITRKITTASISVQTGQSVNNHVLSASLASATNVPTAAGVTWAKGAHGAPTTLTCRPNIILRLHLAYVMRRPIVYVDGGRGTQHIASQLSISRILILILIPLPFHKFLKKDRVNPRRGPRG